MTITNYLLLLILAVVTRVAYPSYAPIADVILVGLLAVGAFTALNKYLAHQLVKKGHENDRKVNESKYWKEFQPQHEEIRRKFDPDRTWNEGTVLPEAYVEEMLALNEKYASVLKMRHGDN